MKKIVTSPLRYPGSKQKFCSTLQKVISDNNISPEIFIEPFAGGASVSLYMLQHNYTKKIALIDKDPLIASFWHTLFFEPEWLIKEIRKLEVSIDKWHFFKKYKPRTKRTRALKCLFLNRTNFSGILKAGPLGGIEQNSKYKIGDRFNKESIIEKIEILSSYRDRVLFIEEGDYKEILKKKFREIDELKTFIYFDPPYIHKAHNLYNFFFEEKDHLDLANFIQSLKANWLLSYDYDPLLFEFYERFSNCGSYNIRYTAAATDKDRPVKKEFIASNMSLKTLEIKPSL